MRKPGYGRAPVARRHLLAAGMLACIAARAAVAQDAAMPARPLRLVVPFPPGGLVDALARGLAPGLRARLGQPLVVEPRPGGNTVIGAEAVARSAPDGTTLLLATDATLSINPHLFRRLPYDPEADFAPVAPVARTIEWLMVPASLPVADLAGLVALAKARPGTLNYGSFGPGSTPHLATEKFRALAGIDIVHVPFRGVAETIPALLAGQIQILIASQAAALPHLRAGTLRALAVMHAGRQPAMPEVPTVGEAGYRGAEGSAWFGVVAPAATPAPVIARLAAAFGAAAAEPEFRERLILGLGLEPFQASPAAFAAFLRADRAAYGERIRALGLEAN